MYKTSCDCSSKKIQTKIPSGSKLLSSERGVVLFWDPQYILFKKIQIYAGTDEYHNQLCFELEKTKS